MKYIFITLALISFFSCRNYFNESFDEIILCNKDTIINITPPKYTYKATIEVIESCNSGSIGLMNRSDSVYKFIQIDTIGFVFENDWYNNEMKLKYISDGLKSGKLNLRIIFYQ